MNCRFNKKELINKIQLIAKYKKNINLHQKDALELIKQITKESDNNNTIFYFDPPYYLKGPGLYKNSYKDDDHKKVADQIKEIKNIHWIISYDNTLEIEIMYEWVPSNFIKKYFLTHSAYQSRKGQEILFFSQTLKNLNLLSSI